MPSPGVARRYAKIVAKKEARSEEKQAACVSNKTEVAVFLFDNYVLPLPCATKG